MWQKDYCIYRFDQKIKKNEKTDMTITKTRTECKKNKGLLHLLMSPKKTKNESKKRKDK